MKRFVLVVVLVLLPLCAFADAEKEALSEELVQMMQMDRMMNQMKIQVQRMIGQMNTQFDIPEHARADYEAFQKGVMDKAFEVMDFEGSRGEIKRLFVEVYSVEELKGIVEFYRSPVGQSLLEKQPQVMSKALEMTQQKMKALIPELQRMSLEFSESLKEKHK